MTPRGAYSGLSPSGVPKTIGARIRKIRTTWGWTQGELAGRLNTDQQIISAWERDVAQPSRANIALLAEFFGLPIEALSNGEGFEVPEFDPPAAIGQGEQRCMLPNAEAGAMIAFPLGGGDRQTLSLKDAKKLLDLVHKKNGRAWIVFDIAE